MTRRLARLLLFAVVALAAGTVTYTATVQPASRSWV